MRAVDGDGRSNPTAFDIVVVGGFGHVGLPLAVSFAASGQLVCALDVNAAAGKEIAAGHVPFEEAGCEAPLRESLKNGRLQLSLDATVVANAAVVIIVIGTPVDEHLNPEFGHIWQLISSLAPHLKNNQLVVLRSTLFPGTTEQIRTRLSDMGCRVEVAYCPERIAEGKAMEELRTLPQIISSFSDEGLRRCRELFQRLTSDIIELRPLEAELAKLFNNTWRYTLFATANQFFMLANDHGADFYRIYDALTHNYPRAQSMPRPGFAAGPCLFKDAMQLAAFNNHSFYLGHAAMLINEGLPNYLVDRLKRQCQLSTKTVGILGMAFKANSDDRRESLSYKLRKVLLFEARAVLSSDPFVKDDDFITTAELVDRSDVIFLGTPHDEYRDLKIPDGKIVIDIWNLWGAGCSL